MRDVTVVCPCCRAVNASGPACRRCKADLGLLFDLEKARSGHLADGGRHARDGRWDEALKSLAAAQELRPGTDVDRLTAALHLIRRDFPSAYQTLISLGLVSCYAGKRTDC